MSNVNNNNDGDGSIFKLNNGLTLPAVGLGTYAWLGTGERDQLPTVVYDAIAAGVRHIDTAWIYMVEDKVGEGIKKAIDEGLVKREELTVVTKIWTFNMKRDRLIGQAKLSLHNLGLKYVDILMLHWPVPTMDQGKKEEWPRNPDGSFALDNETDIYNETWPAMEELVDQGIAKSIGVSNFTPTQIETLMKTARIKPVVNQVESTPFLPQSETLEVCRKHGIVMTAYSPFGGSPQPQRDKTFAASNIRAKLWQHPTVVSLAEKYNKTVCQILLKFHVQRGVAVVPKSVSPERIKQNLDIFDFELTPDELDSLINMKTGERMLMIKKLTASKYNPYADDK
jgi:diketogulonate reductase-like aldo/keto reductase